MRAMDETRSSASRSEMSRACRETVRSSGEFHAGSEGTAALATEHDCAMADRAGASTATEKAIARAGDRREIGQ